MAILDGFFDRARKLGLVSPAETPNPPIVPRDYEATMYGPGQPLVPYDNKESSPRYFDYLSQSNTGMAPRTEYNDLIPTFNELWTAYLANPQVRVCIDFRIGQIAGIPWDVQAKGEELIDDLTLEKARAMVKTPDPKKGLSFGKWLRSVLIETFVTDAPTIYIQRDKLGRPLSWMQIDGQTIKPLIDSQGSTPMEGVSYQQWIKGYPKTGFSLQDIVYHPFRPRPWCVYGESPLESIIATVGSYQLFMNWTDDYFTKGNIPDVFIIPDSESMRDWGPKQIKEWQDTMDTLAGQNSARRRFHLLPPFAKDVKETKSFTFDKAMPDWLIRTFCVEFGVPSHLFVSESNRATAQAANEITNDAQNRQLLSNVKELVDDCLSKSGFPMIEFVWKQEQDYKLENVQGVKLLIDAGVMTPEEARDYLGFDAQGGIDHTQEEEAAAGEPVPDAGTPPEATETKSVTKSVDKVNRRMFAGKAALKRVQAAARMLPAVRKVQRRVLSEVLADAERKAHHRAGKLPPHPDKSK